jgi:acyl-CoA synthetase (NDP forming)
MSIVGFARSTKMGVAAIDALPSKSDLEEDDLLRFFEQDPNTEAIVWHREDLKDGRALAELASQGSRPHCYLVRLSPMGSR